MGRRLILSYGIIDATKDVVEKTYLYADSKNYMSWEEFYTSYLVELSKDTKYHYNKARLNEIYKGKTVFERIVGAIPESIRNI